MSSHWNGTVKSPHRTMFEPPTLPIRIRQKPGRHRAPDGTPSSVATWAGGRHFRPEVAR